MMILVGLLIVFGMVFGGYLLSGGSMEVMLHALPFEGMMVGGAALGAFVIANNFNTLKMAGGAVFRSIKGPRWKNDDYMDLLMLLYELAKLYNQRGVQGIEQHIENSESSSIFSKYPRIARDHHTRCLIVDSFRLLLMQFDDPHEMEDIINRRLEAHHRHAHEPIHALAMVSDGLPAIGIVAAVLGVIKTMASIDKPPEILGTMIGGALVGTFLGVFLAYCLVTPIAQRVAQIEKSDAGFGEVIRDVIVAIMKGHAPSIVLEIGRGSTPTDVQPEFDAVELKAKEIKVGNEQAA